jgi:serine phosphatase RsbU (regulator of sigma subunit)
MQGGFVTCCAARIGRDGNVAIASAGHLAPYRNGNEIPTSAGLPLGVTADSAFFEAALTLSPGDRLTFLTDGVVEARNPAGELFGFDRTRAISTEPAEEIARRAQHFGQDDDITVLTLAYTPAAH